MKKNYLGLKFGWIKWWHFEEGFCNTHKNIIDKLEKLDNEVCKGCYSMFEISQKEIKEQKTKLVEILDYLFDTKEVTIFNDFDNKTYRSKLSYRKYLLKD